MGQVFSSSVLRFFPVSIIAQVRHARVFDPARSQKLTALLNTTLKQLLGSTYAYYQRLAQLKYA
jgi:hypothetical protein